MAPIHLGLDHSPCFSPDSIPHQLGFPSVSQWGTWETRLLLEPDAVGTSVKAPCQHPELGKLFTLVLG